jgi:hypothetical protein
MESGDVCVVTNTAAGRPSGNPATIRLSGSNAPAEPPMATTAKLAPLEAFIKDFST